ncbi:hypothetical protein GUJ93_ZPchr0012g19532 [Zizania palustris]|uniref:Uncharacterized protein n=1 Tax=Zizania palustris TaxID=103762 RepID=A0A8J5WRH1_ZIZPA|nr:hypothetical protein GUJ93_ZPchr0012g19532 [Zizania palustris]
MLGQHVGGLASTLLDKGGRLLALRGSGGGSLGSGECDVDSIHVGKAEGGHVIRPEDGNGVGSRVEGSQWRRCSGEDRRGGGRVDGCDDEEADGGLDGSSIDSRGEDG